MKEKDIAEIIKLRGLGFNNKEIAARFGVTGGAINYHVRNIKKRASKEGEDVVFLTLLAPYLIRRW